jgi:hypothetical protein
MQAWRGWTAAGAATTHALTWAEWCAWHQRTLQEERRDERRRPDGIPFSERERARLLFVRWLYQSGRLGPPECDSV